MGRVDDGDLSGKTIGHYSVVALIAAGGQGQVYRGRDERLHRTVAIKALGADHVSDPVARRNLKTEARVLSRLNHPNVAGIYDFVTQGGCDYIVMEFVAGATLRDMLAGGPLPAGEVLRLGLQIAHGLACAHAANVVHRDLKPANLKITSFGELKILDFGLAKLLPAGALVDNGTRTTVSGAVVGTVPYMAPERLTARRRTSAATSSAPVPFCTRWRRASRLFRSGAWPHWSTRFSSRSRQRRRRQPACPARARAHHRQGAPEGARRALPERRGDGSVAGRDLGTAGSHASSRGRIAIAVPRAGGFRRAWRPPLAGKPRIGEAGHVSQSIVGSRSNRCGGRLSGG